MKKQVIKNLLALAALLALQSGCSTSEEKTDNSATETTAAKAHWKDTLKIYLDARKMEMNASSLAQAGVYDSALSRYNKCISFLNSALSDNNNQGLILLGGVIIEVNESKEVIYDSLHQPENSINCILEYLKWAKTIHNYSLQISSDTKVAGKLKNRAASITNDTAKKGSLLRQALQYALAGARVIDSLKTNDMDDLRYAAFHTISKVYGAAGDKNQAGIYDKKYRDLYFKIYRRRPEND
jgi:hypothetical protein